MQHQCLTILSVLMLTHNSFAQSVNTNAHTNAAPQKRFPIIDFNIVDLELVSQWTLKLVAQQEPPYTDHLKSISRFMVPMLPGRINFSASNQIKTFPRASHLRDYFLTRPWALYTLPSRHHSEFVSLFLRTSKPFDHWSGHREIFHKQLSHDQPAIRALAIEALSVMHHPEDVPRIATYLDDTSEALPALSPNMCMSSTTFFDHNQTFDQRSPNANPVMLRYSWLNLTVKQYAQLALKRMTGFRFEDKAQFDVWWLINHDAKNCYWYWQQRLTREMAEVDLSASLQIKLPSETWERYQSRLGKISQIAIDDVRQSAINELAQCTPEVQTKIVMCCELEQNTGILWQSSQAHRQFSPSPPAGLQVNPEYLLDYLENQAIWPDLKIHSQDNMLNFSMGHPHHIFVGNLLRWAYRLFEPTHLPRLQALLQSTEYQADHSGRLGILLCIAMLHPQANAGNLDDPDTRDSILRQVIRTEPSRDMQRWCVELLTRIGLPQNATLLKDHAFKIHADDPDNEMLQSILKVLIAQPLTEIKRDFLVNLLLDRRFDRWWVYDHMQMGADMCCRYAIDAINTYSGFELIDNELENRIRFPEGDATEAIPEIRKRIAELKTLPLPQ